MASSDTQENIVEIHKISKTFKLPHERHTSIKSALLNFYRKNKSYEEQRVLKDISFKIKKGEFFGIVGRNGSGKSTLLKLLAGIYMPGSGKIQVNGSLTPFIELGVGFNPELTGRENVFLNGALLGFNRKEMTAMYEDIVSFAELERFMDQKLKNYSSGMQVRLAFSIAIRANSDILLIDEVLAVGDAIFQKKCFNYFKELKRLKKTVILVSHDASILQEYCDRGVLLERGGIVSEGRISSVVKDYIDLLNDQEEKQGLDDTKEKMRWGTGDIKVLDIKTLDAATDKPRTVFTDDHKTIRVMVRYKSQGTYKDPVYGITITDGSGQRIFDSNTLWSKVASKTVHAAEIVSASWDVPNVFNPGDFKVSPAVANSQATTIYDWWDEATIFKVRKTLQSSALTSVPHSIRVINNKSKNKES